MKKVIIIGTVHLNWTPHKELIEEVKKHNPDKVLIELTEKEVLAGKDKSNRDEMFAILEWIKQVNINYSLFDTNINTFKSGITGKEAGFVEYELRVKNLLKDYEWKKLNSQAPWHIKEVKELEDYLVEKYFDKEKMQNRNREIENNIQSELVSGVNVVVTGAGHVSDLLKALPNSTAPLR